MPESVVVAVAAAAAAAMSTPATPFWLISIVMARTPCCCRCFQWPYMVEDKKVGTVRTAGRRGADRVHNAGKHAHSGAVQANPEPRALFFFVTVLVDGTVDRDFIICTTNVRKECVIAIEQYRSGRLKNEQRGRVTK
jgi:hypothetical protein